MDPLFAIAFFVFGLAFGSFLNVCIYRMPRRIILLDERDQLAAEIAKYPHLYESLQPKLDRVKQEIREASVMHGRSACPRCHAQIGALDNIPLVSWLVLRGRCRNCGAPISPRYWLVELLTGLLFFACYLRFGLDLLALKLCVLSFLLLGLIFTDAEHKLLPDALTLPGIGLGLGFSAIVPVNDLLLHWFNWLFAPRLVFSPMLGEGAWRASSMAQSVGGALVGAGFIYGTGYLYQRARGVEGMGLGDVKLMAMIGAFLGVSLTVFTIFAGSLVGSLFGLATMLVVWLRRTRRRVARMRESLSVARQRAWHSAKLVYRYQQVPFGVFLGAMALLAAFYGNALLRWYWQHFL